MYMQKIRVLTLTRYSDISTVSADLKEIPLTYLENTAWWVAYMFFFWVMMSSANIEIIYLQIGHLDWKR